MTGALAITKILDLLKLPVLNIDNSSCTILTFSPECIHYCLFMCISVVKYKYAPINF